MDNSSINKPRIQTNFNQTFQSSLIQNGHQKFAVQKSLAKGIKDNDVSKIVHTGQDGGMEDKKNMYDQKAEIAAVAIQMRAKFDQIKDQSNRTQDHIAKMRSQIQSLKIDEKNLEQIHQKQKNDLEQVEKKLKNITAATQDILFRKDIYESMSNNTKHDILILKKRYFDFQIVMNRDKTKLKTLKTQAFNKKKLGLSCRKMLESVQKTVTFKQQQRSTKINSFCQVLSKKQDNVKRKVQRQKQIEDVMLAAMTQKSQQEKQWVKIFITNLFLKYMLKAKMEKIMETHAVAEKAFQTIKLQTGVTHAQDFIGRYLNRQQNYGILLESISQKQSKLENLKLQKQQLQEKHQNLLYQLDEINQLSKKLLIIPQADQKVIDKINTQLVHIQRLKQVLYQWSIKLLTGFSGLSRRDAMYKKYSRKQLKLIFSDSLNTIKDFLTKLETEAEADKKIDKAFMQTGPKTKILSQDMFQRNIRIKTLQTNDDYGVYEQMEDGDMAYDDISQMDYLNHYRRAIKKNDYQNRKFRIKTKPN